MTAETTVTDNRSSETVRPYPVNKPSFKVMDRFQDGDTKYSLICEFKRLDSDNFRILLKKEEATERITETMTKNRSRDRLSVDEAHSEFFNSLALQGILESNEDDAKPEILSYQQMTEIVVERKIALNVKYLDCKAIVKQIVGAGKHDFLFEKPGHMVVEFMIGDPEAPDFRLLLKFRRPGQNRRSKFREGFAYGITDRAGDLPVVKTIIDLSTGVHFMDEYFETVIVDPNYSKVVFLKDDGTLDHEYVEGNDDDRKLFLKYFNPHFKVEQSGAMVATFSKSGRES
jgi:hypothetical protein